MNLQELKKHIGKLHRLRPKPHRIDGNGIGLPSLDDQWRLERIDRDPNRITLANIRTGHFVELQSDNVRQYQSPDFLMLRCQLTLSPKGIDIEPLPTSTRKPIPIARYQARPWPSSTLRYVPLRPQVCDGCTAAVQFRPLTRMELLDNEEPHEGSEQFCPPCARRRGIDVPPPEGMTREVLYADTNPSFHYHLARVLRHNLLSALGADADLRALGVSGVGAIVTGRSVTLVVDGAWQGHVEVPLELRALHAASVADTALAVGIKTAITAALAQRRSLR